jgi:hypothetical protein
MIEIYAHLANTRRVIAESMALLARQERQIAPKRGWDVAKEAMESSPLKVEPPPIQMRGSSADRGNDGWLSYDALTVELEAHRLLRSSGSTGVALARKNAAASDAIGDMLSAEAWRDIADEAQRILGRR